MRIRTILLSLFISLESTLCSGQSFTLYNYSVNDGLPSSEVYEIFQDRNGFIWFATDNGVAKYDGYEMKIFHVKDNLSDPVVFGFHEDQVGKLWFRTFSGVLSYYFQGKIEHYQNNSQVAKFTSDEIMYNLRIERDNLWFSTTKVIVKIDSAGNITKESIPPGRLLYRSLEHGGIEGAFGPSGKINVIDIDGKLFPIRSYDSLNHNHVFRSIQWRNKIYLSINNAIYEYDNLTIKKVFTGVDAIISLSTDLEENLWVGYKNQGAERFQHSNFDDSWKPEFLREKSVTKVIQDHEKGFWFSTLEKGVYYIPNMRIKNFSLHDDVKPTAVLATDESVLVGDQTGTLWVYDPIQIALQWKKNLGNRIMALGYDDRKNVWVSSGMDTYIYQKEHEINKMKGYSIVNFSANTTGMMWAVGYTAISKITMTTHQLYTLPVQHLYRSIYVDDSLVFLAPRTGLHISDQTLKYISIPKEFGNIKISKLISLNDSTILAATLGSGFLLIHKKTWKYTQFDSRTNFIANNIYDIIKTDTTLWLGTEKGLINTSIKGLFTGNYTYNYITERSGLKSNKIDFLAQSQNAIWVFSDTNVSIVPYDFQQFANPNPKIYFKDLTVNNVPVSITHNLKLAYDQNNIQLTLGYISFNSQSIIMRYRLATNGPWIKSSERILQLASISPGNYNLEMEYSVDNIHWIPVTHPLSFTIFPPFWKRWYFQLSATIVLLFLIYIYYNNRILIYRQKHQHLQVINGYQEKLLKSEIETLERERIRIAKELHDGVSTNLTATKLMVNQLLLSGNSTKQAMGEVEEQFQNTIKEIKDIIYALVPLGLQRYGLLSSLRNYIEKLNKSISAKIDLHVFSDEIYNTQLSMPLFRVIQELLSNSLKHSHAKNITIHVNSFDDLLNIVYEDNGIGFSESAIQRGLGLDNIKARIQSIKGTMKFESGHFGICYSIDIPLQSKDDFYD